MNLVLAETLIAVFGLPIDFLASYQYGWKMGKSFCVITGFIHTFSGKFLFWMHIRAGADNYLILSSV